MDQSNLYVSQVKEFLKNAYKITYLYHMTHINNLKSIFQYGLLSHNVVHQNINISDISLKDVQNIRAKKTICNISLHDYVPFYFRPKNPMLFKRINEQENIVFLCIDPIILLEKNTVFSDGNAASKDTKFYKGIESLGALPWDGIRSRYWNDIEDGKRIKCAEILAYPQVSVEHILKIFCYSQDCVWRILDLRPKGFRYIPIEPSEYLYFR